MFKCDIYCPSENWRIEVLLDTLPRNGDQLRHEGKLYRAGGAEYVIIENAGADTLQYYVRKPLVYVSPLK